MKKITNLLFLLAISLTVAAQDTDKNIINSTLFIEKIKQALFNNSIPLNNTLLIPAGKTFYSAEIVFKESSSDTITLRGSIKNFPNSNFYLDYDGSSISGAMILNRENAYKFSSDSLGHLTIYKENIENIICTPFPQVTSDRNFRTSPVTDSITELTASANNLESLPGCPYVVFLDFDGFYVAQGTRWNNGKPIDAKPSQFSDAKIVEAWQLVAEDYKPFNLNITTSEAVFNKAVPGRRMRAVITPTNTAAPKSGGVAFMFSFTLRTKEEPCFIFNLGSAKVCGETVSHEVGHTLGLKHDGRDTAEYFMGQNGWGAIMGSVYGYNMLGQFSKGEYAKATNKEDDLLIITTKNGFTYKKDDFSNVPETSTSLTIDNSGKILPSNKGIIEKASDIDIFKFTTSGGKVEMIFNPAVPFGDLDILVKLYNQRMDLLLTSNLSGLATSINTVLVAGQYYISIDGTGKGSPLSDGYSDYGSLGSYFISGSIPFSNSASNVTSTYEGELSDAAVSFPNPFQNDFTISKEGEFQYYIFAADGKLVESGKGTDNLVTGKYLLPGLYTLKIETLSSSNFVKLVKQ